jgi:hypothetical protein
MPIVDPGDRVFRRLNTVIFGCHNRGAGRLKGSVLRGRHSWHGQPGELINRLRGFFDFNCTVEDSTAFITGHYEIMSRQRMISPSKFRIKGGSPVGSSEESFG